MSERMPAWFLAHGAPLHMLGDQPVRQFWRQLPERLLQPPRALLCLSAHWLTRDSALAGNVPQPNIQYDFQGFPEQLYRIEWPLQGDSKTALWLESRLASLLSTLQPQPERPIDYCVWVPLIHGWPAPAFPVYQLSICPQQGALWHLELGRLLAPLRDEGVLIVGSGGIVHNLARLDWQAARGASEPWAADFMEVVERAIQRQDYAALCDPWSLPHGRDAVPTLEHYLPLLVTLGCSLNEAPMPLYRDWEYGNLAMHSYRVGAVR